MRSFSGADLGGTSGDVEMQNTGRRNIDPTPKKHTPSTSVNSRHPAPSQTSTTCLDPNSCYSATYPSSTASNSLPPHQFRTPKRPENAYLAFDRGLPADRIFAPSKVSLDQCCDPTPPVNHNKFRKMGLSKSQRISILLAVDTVFFFIELIIGYAVHSLALVADAFHMLNDVLSLCVGLWAVRIAQSGSSKMYTYGWQRAETLGALINGVFLVALCVTIFLEAIQRFVEKPNVSNPKLVLIVGCLGLASNILGLFLFHDHGHGGHSHGEGEAEHSHEVDPVRNAEEGHSHSHEHSRSHDQSTEQTNLLSGKKSEPVARDFSRSDEEGTTISGNSTTVAPVSPLRKSVSGNADFSRYRRRASSSYGRGFGSIDDIAVHPASFRNDIIQASRLEDVQSEIGEDATPFEDHEGNFLNLTPEQNGHQSKNYGTLAHHKSVDYSHHKHIHNQPREQESSGGHGHGHSHGDLNMQGVFLHVMGDALGNIGVIATALIIWLTTFEGRFYFDPAISLVITAIILWNAIPLCKAASRILLQAVPVGLSIDEIREDIESLPRVVEAHHLHVWQLSDTKLVASLHVKVDCEIEGTGSASYMKLAREIRACLHGYGIHSSTIQPEFMQTTVVENGENAVAASSGNSSGDERISPKTASKAGSLLSADGRAAGPGCMLDCEDDCGSTGQCCPTTDGKGQK